MAFTSLVKEIVKSATSYVKTSKIVLKKERGVNLNHKAFIMREVEDKVDADAFHTAEEFMEEFSAFCARVAEK